MKKYAYGLWLKDISQLGPRLFEIGASGTANLVIGPKSAEEATRKILAALPSDWSECIEFLAGFYSCIGSSLVLEINVQLPHGWVTDEDDQDDGNFYSHLELVGPDELLTLADFNSYREQLVSAQPLDMGINWAALADILPPGHIEKQKTEQENFRDIIGECLMFCKDDVGGGIAFYGGRLKRKGVYAVSMFGARFVTESMSEFFDTIQRHMFHRPVCETEWDSKFREEFRDRLICQTGGS